MGHRNNTINVYISEWGEHIVPASIRSSVVWEEHLVDNLNPGCEGMQHVVVDVDRSTHDSWVFSAWLEYQDMLAGKPVRRLPEEAIAALKGIVSANKKQP